MHGTWTVRPGAGISGRRASSIVGLGQRRAEDCMLSKWNRMRGMDQERGGAINNEFSGVTLTVEIRPVPTSAAM